MDHIWPKHGNSMVWPMALLWVIYGFCMGYCFLYQAHRWQCLPRILILMSLIWDCYVFGAAHTFPIVFSMGMIWFHTIAKPWECCVYCTIPYHFHIIQAKGDLIWECSHPVTPFPYHFIGILLLVWECYGWW